MESVKRHNFDDSSPEAKIASITGIIRYLQIIIDTYKDKTPPRHLRVYLKELVEKRSKRLRKLRLADYKLFEWVIENLDLIHKARPTPNPEKVERKKSLRRLTDLYCDTLRQERLDQYRDHLESQHEKFLQEKLETLQWIQNKEKECGINLTVSDEEIECVSEELEKVKKLNKQKIVEED
ncbi:28S ribosomal protein S15, mitochondrial isoform X2 [Lycorma delicatula]